jgi:hypothetical protein
VEVGREFWTAGTRPPPRLRVKIKVISYPQVKGKFHIFILSIRFSSAFLHQTLIFAYFGFMAAQKIAQKICPVIQDQPIDRSYMSMW